MQMTYFNIYLGRTTLFKDGFQVNRIVPYLSMVSGSTELCRVIPT